MVMVNVGCNADRDDDDVAYEDACDSEGFVCMFCRHFVCILEESKLESSDVPQHSKMRRWTPVLEYRY